MTFLLTLLLFIVLHTRDVFSAPTWNGSKGTLESEYVDGGSSSPSSAPIFANEKEDLLRRFSAAHTIELSCKAKGNPTPKVVWFKNGEELSKLPTRRYEPVETRKWIIRIKNAIPDDDGEYTCVVENDSGKIQRTFDVKVIPRIVAHKPVIITTPGNKTLLVGAELILQCEPDLYDVSNPPIITFMKHDELSEGLSQDNGISVVETLQKCSIRGVCEMQDLNHTFTTYNLEDPTVLHLFNLTTGDSGWYSCIVENELGVSAASSYVSIISEFPIDPNIVETEKQRQTFIIGTVTVVPLVILSVCCSIIFYCRWKKEEERKIYAADAFKHVYQWTKVVLVEKQQNAHNAEPLLDPVVTIKKKKLPTAEDDCPETEYELASDPLWEVDRNELLFPSKTLGEGAFGKVVLAYATKPLRRWKEMGLKEVVQRVECQVAVKMLKECHSDEDLMDLVKEMEIMKAIGFHTNIVNLLGVSTQPTGKPLLLIIEFAENGNLKDYLVSHRPPASPTSWSSWYREEGYERPTDEGIDLKLMLKMAFEVAKGMEFLSSKKCVHRDLAARNVLVTKDLQVKISDFGMARDIKTSEYYRKVSGGRVPLKWMAPEAVFQQVSTTKSDVWSFGILLYEIVTLGESPYKNVIIDTFLEQLRIGTRMKQPINCPDNVYEVMFNCWKMRPETRPEWSQLVNTLRELYTGN